MCESRSLNVKVGALYGCHVYKFMRNGSFSTIGHMVNIIVIQEIAIDEIQGDIVHALAENDNISHEKQPQILPGVQS